MKKKQIILILSLIVLLGLLWALWIRIGSTTRIGLVNFPAFMSTSIKLSNTDKFIEYEDIDLDDNSSNLDKYDFVLGFGMGLKITKEQRVNLQKYIDDKFPMYFFAATSPENKISTLDSIDLASVQGYLGNGNKKNYKNLARYIRSRIDKKVLFVQESDKPIESVSDVLYHLDEEKYFKKVSEYENYLKSKGIFKVNAPKIAIVGGMNDPFSGNRANMDSIIVAFERSGMNVYPISSFAKRLDFLKEVNPDAVLYFPHGRMIMGQADIAVEWLKSRNIPLFAPLTILQKEEDWEADAMGMFGGFMSQSIMMPELDGAIYPYVLSAQEERKDGMLVFKAIPDRVRNFTTIVKNFISLKSKPNKDKKIAIYYFKGPGQSTLSAQGLKTVESIYNLISRLKKEGYKVDNLPDDVKEFEKMIMKQGVILNTYAEGAFDDFLKNGNPALIKTSDYESWVGKSMPKSLYKEVIDTYGEAPGKYMAVQKDNKSYLAVARLEFGNVAILPQPMSALGGDSFAIVHGAKSPPPHTYISAYLWAQYGFEADAIMHFGTHGSLEFTPRKQVALSSYDWPDRLIGTIPHFYYYTIGNIGESVMTKRRSYATTISYLTPPFMESKTRGQFNLLHDAIHEYFRQPEDKQDKVSLKIKKIAIKMGLHRYLRLDSILTKPYSVEDITRIENFAEEIANEKMTGELYTTGKPYAKDKIISSVFAMTVDPIAYSIAALDKRRGKISQTILKHKHLFAEAYLDPAKKLVGEILRGKAVNEALICSLASISPQELAESRLILTPKKRMMMGGGKSSMTKGGKNPHAMGGHPESKGGHSHPHAVGGHPEGKGGHSHPNAVGGHPESKGGHSHPHAMGGHPEGKGGHSHPHAVGGHPDGKGSHSHPHGKHIAQKSDVGILAMEKAMNNMHKLKDYTKEQKRMARAILEIEKAILNVKNYKKLLENSPEFEMQAIVNAFNGGYIIPGPGGDAIANPNALPTGRNLYSINAEATPSEVAWEKGVGIAKATLAEYKKRHGEYPKKISYTFWSSEFIETQGATIAQVLYMLGVEPVRDTYGRVTDLQLIDSKTLGRPRVDIVVQTSGQFRDLAASRLALITKAVELAAQAKDDDFKNQVAESTIETERLLVEQGMSPKIARDMSTQRVFGGINGMYGTNIQGMVTSSDKWEDEKEIADTYINNMGAIYGGTKNWGAFQAGLLKAVLHNTDAIIHPRQSNTWGALSLDHVYEFMGGMNLAIRNVTGKDPEAYFADYRNRNNFRVQELKEAIGVEATTTIFNPAYIQEIMKSGASGAGGIEETITNTFGWNVMKPKVIDKEMWDEIYNVYVKDKFKLGTQQFFEKESPASLQEITAIMLEANRKGMWKATDEQIRTMADLHTELVKKYGASGNGFSGGNKKLQNYISQKISPTKAADYKRSLDKINKVEKAKNNGKVLKKEELVSSQSLEKNNLNGIIVVAVVLVVFVGIILIWRRKRRK